MDEPLADAAAVALYFLNQEAAREYKVCLSGEGADELFAGYNICLLYTSIVQTPPGLVCPQAGRIYGKAAAPCPGKRKTAPRKAQRCFGWAGRI